MQFDQSLDVICYNVSVDPLEPVQSNCEYWLVYVHKQGGLTLSLCTLSPNIALIKFQ